MQKIKQIKKYCLDFPGVEEQLFSAPANILTYTIGGKKFAYFKTSDPEKWRFSFRVLPDREAVRVVVLPTKSSAAIDVLYLESINDELVRRLLQIEGIDVISRTAIEANAGNPFPYFSQQFGAQWVIESRVSANSSGRKLSLNLVDARSASIVNMKIQRYGNNEEKLNSAFDEFIDDSQQFFLPQ